MTEPDSNGVVHLVLRENRAVIARLSGLLDFVALTRVRGPDNEVRVSKMAIDSILLENTSHL